MDKLTAPEELNFDGNVADNWNIENKDLKYFL